MLREMSASDIAAISGSGVSGVRLLTEAELRTVSGGSEGRASNYGGSSTFRGRHNSAPANPKRLIDQLHDISPVQPDTKPDICSIAPDTPVSDAEDGVASADGEKEVRGAS